MQGSPQHLDPYLERNRYKTIVDPENREPGQDRPSVINPTPLIEEIMNRIKRVLMWPARPGSCYVPWFVVLWRCVWWPIYLAGLAICVVALLMSQGRYAAGDFWANAR